ncbi:MAG TPA: threonine/serine exporter family protein [Rhizomicrobium sp.]
MTEKPDPVRLKHRRLEQIAMTALRASRLLTECGARVRVAHDGAALIVRGLGVDLVGLRTGYASQEVTVSSGANTITRMMTIGPHGVNHRLDHALRALAVRVSKGGMSVEDTEREMDRLVKETPRHPAWFVAVAVGIACAAFGRLLGIDWVAFAPVLAAGAVGQYMRHLLLKRGVNSYIVATAIAFLAAAVAGEGARLAGSTTVNLAMMASMLLLVPGVPATNAQTDIMDGFPTMGSARAVSVIMVMVFATTGVWLAEALLGVE